MGTVTDVVMDGNGAGIPDGYELCSGGLYQTGSGSCETFSVLGSTYVMPAYTYQVGGGTYKGQPSGSMASSGDPFDIRLGGGNGYANPSVTLTAAVPEPSAYVLMLACLGLIGATMRKRSA